MRTNPEHALRLLGTDRYFDLGDSGSPGALRCPICDGVLTLTFGLAKCNRAKPRRCGFERKIGGRR